MSAAPRDPRGRNAREHSRPGPIAPAKRSDLLGAMSSHDSTVLALVLVERLSLTEAAAALDLSVAELRRDYEAALARVRRSIAPVVARADRVRADLARALTRPAPPWRRVS